MLPLAHAGARPYFGVAIAHQALRPSASADMVVKKTLIKITMDHKLYQSHLQVYFMRT
jgi:hypothetical protein